MFSTPNFECLMQLNLIKDNKVTKEDANLDKKVCGPGTRILDRKSARLKLVPVAGNAAKIPNKLISINKELKLSIDRLSVNGLKFTNTIAHDLFSRSAVLIKLTC